MALVSGSDQENTVLNLLFMFEMFPVYFVSRLISNFNLLFMFEIFPVYVVSRLISNFTIITITDSLRLQDHNQS